MLFPHIRVNFSAALFGNSFSIIIYIIIIQGWTSLFGAMYGSSLVERCADKVSLYNWKSFNNLLSLQLSVRQLHSGSISQHNQSTSNHFCAFPFISASIWKFYCILNFLRSIATMMFGECNETWDFKRIFIDVNCIINVTIFHRCAAMNL